MKTVLDKIRKFAENDDKVSHVEVSFKTFSDLLAEEGASRDCREFRFPVSRSLELGLPAIIHTTYTDIRVYPTELLQYPFIFLNGKYPRNINRYPTPEHPYEGSVTPACDHSFVNVGFTSIKLICKHCDMEK